MTKPMQDLKHGYRLLFDIFRSISEDCTGDLERVRREGRANPLTSSDVKNLLTTCFEAACRGARDRGDVDTARQLEERRDSIMEQVLAQCSQDTAERKPVLKPAHRALRLESHDGVDPHPVRPHPVFHGHRLNVFEGFVDVSDISLSADNQRLQIHVDQFKATHGRAPTPDDLVRLISSQANLSGLDAPDQFKIIDLARSIATGGVRQPPIISHQGNLLDGNRRVAACLHVLQSDDFQTREKSRAKKIRVWQLADDATPEDETAVVVALNFEPDCKVDWPEYVKGRIIYNDWRAALALEDKASAERQRTIKLELARQYAITVDRVNRYIEMVKLANEFEEHHRNTRNKNSHEVQHRTNQYFQYFDELGKGRGAGGVNHAINIDDSFRSLVFDLLYDGKFRNFAQIRGLKHVAKEDEAKGLLRKAKQDTDIDYAQDRVEEALSVARSAQVMERKVGGNKRIETFVKWLREVPIEFFSVGEIGAITEKNLRALHEALKLIQGHFPSKWDHPQPHTDANMSQISGSNNDEEQDDV